ncbi:uncharacterized protein [Blastocystis hominis]|uniref:Rhodanese domain-containing protein n=1 Tax=Blastocystis hominis TaxID=12968 RepID=D8LV62_BLAHO|nr:uncharacterized protein [Blastocystis hominis]CBK19701.2 unnamed protein product [Blastocystis hominis]|eukprot:XP_012893749.1 uncharacterized protein [Blastocystis hominis]
MNVSRIQGAISYNEYLVRLDNENFPFVKTICYSTIGHRSCEVVRELLKKGVKAFSLEGGLIAWCGYEKGEIVDKNNNPTRLVHVFDPEYRPLFSSSYVCVY